MDRDGASGIKALPDKSSVGSIQVMYTALQF